MAEPHPALVRMFLVRIILLAAYCLAYACLPVRSESVPDKPGMTYSMFWPLAWLCER